MNIQYSPSDGFAWPQITEGSDQGFSSGCLIISSLHPRREQLRTCGPDILLFPGYRHWKLISGGTDGPQC